MSKIVTTKPDHDTLKQLTQEEISLLYNIRKQDKSVQSLTKELILVLSQIAASSLDYPRHVALFQDILDGILEHLIGRELKNAEQVLRLSQSKMMLRFRKEKSRYEANRDIFDSLLGEIKKQRPNTSIDNFTLRRLSGLFSIQELRELCLNQSTNTHLDLSRREITNREVAALMQVLNENKTITSLDLRRNELTTIGRDMLLRARPTLCVKIHEERIDELGSLLDKIKQQRPTSKIDRLALCCLNRFFAPKELGDLCLNQSVGAHLDLSDRGMKDREVTSLMQVLGENDKITSVDLSGHHMSGCFKDSLRCNKRDTLRIKM